MNSQQQQQQQTHLDNAVSIKVTFSKTQENRFVALASPTSFAQLVDKTCRAFNVDQVTNVLHVHYIDDEGDRVSVCSDDELTCALLLAAPSRLLRLFVDTAPTAATSTPVNIAPIIDTAPVKQEDVSIAVKTDQEDEEEPACCAQQTTGAAALMLKLETEAGITDIPEKRCVRVLARFNGDMDKAVVALRRCHERKQLRATKQQQQKPDDKLHQRDTRAEQHQARRGERLAARLARQQSRSAPCADDADKLPAEVEALVAFMADKGLPAGRGKCVAALRRSGGDVEAAKAALLAWSTKQEQRRQQKAAGANVEDAFAAQLAKLHELGFGDDGSDRPSAADRLRRRNLRLLAKFGGDVEQVTQHPTARKTQNQARMAERKERVSREQSVPDELAPLLAQLDEKGLGAEEGCDNAQRIHKRNLRLLKKLDGDVERVAAIIESRQARKQARLARRAATSAC